jgi:membrane peptidoglycan carboxypeptidase
MPQAVGTDTAEQDTEREPMRRRWPRRLIDYPRRGRQGFRRWLPSWRLVLGLAFLGLALMVGGFLIALAMVRIPQPNDFATRQATVFDYADGRTRIAHIGVNRISVPLDRIPPVVRNAVLAAEDRSFYSEPAVSPTGILRALRNDLTSGSDSLQGGSTITQQYVKNYYLTERQTVSRKLDEVLVAIKIDQQQPKDTILRNYLNTVFFARGAYGIQAAARAYFDVDVSRLSDDPAKAAYLAALVQQPYYFGTANTDPAADRALRHRWNYVLDGMVTEHWLARDVRARLVFPTTVAQRTNELAGPNGYLVNTAMSYLDQAHQQDPSVPDASMISLGGYTVVTTFRQDYLTAADKAVRSDLASLDSRHNPADRNVHVGLAAVDATTGAVVGIYGGADYVRRGYNDATQAEGPTGSVVGRTLAAGVDAPLSDHWPDAIADLRKLGVTDVHARDIPPSDDDITATPLRAAVAYQAVMNRGIAYQPYEVSEVRHNGAVVWRATPTALGFPDGDRSGIPSIMVNGVDGSHQWAWSVGGLNHIVTAVDMYATKPNGVTTRTLNGMTPQPRVFGWDKMLIAQQRVTQVWETFMTGTPATERLADGH